MTEQVEANCKAKSADSLLTELTPLRGDLKIVSTNGCFDLLHVGHVRYLRKAKSLGDVLVVALNSDASVRRLKGPTRPLVPEQERLEMLAAFEFVDYIVIFDEDTPARFISTIKPDLHVKGGSFDEALIALDRQAVEAQGGEFRILDLEPGRSSTNMIERIIAMHARVSNNPS